MKGFDPEEVRGVVERVRRRYGEGVPTQGVPTQGVPAEATPAGRTPTSAGGGVFATVDGAAQAAWQAFQAYRRMGLEVRHAVIRRIRETMRREAERLGRLAHEETGLGRAADKHLKNLLVTERTPGPEELEPRGFSGDQGMTWVEYAPFGVIGSITPTTNPTATLINNTISIVSAGNAVVFNVHPNAKNVCLETVRLLEGAVVAAGGPPNLVTAVGEPTIETAQQLMRHPRVRILLVTGGPAVVREALKSDKRAITAGPGNPPVVVDETADLALAGREIVRGASFDNNVICTDEKEVFVVDSAADELLRVMERSGGVLLKEHQLRQLERVIFAELGPPGKPGKVNPRWIGQNAGRILGEIGVPAGDEVRLLLAEVPKEHSLVWTEQLMPVMPIVRTRSAQEAMDLAVKAEHGFGHTASMFSTDVHAITRLAREINVSIFVANGPTLAGLGQGGEGYTSFSIASPTGEGLTRPRTFCRERRLALVGSLRIV